MSSPARLMLIIQRVVGLHMRAMRFLGVTVIEKIDEEAEMENFVSQSFAVMFGWNLHI